jgi:cyclophilin family peptidyl-prolyl cis-trans isomerase
LAAHHNPALRAVARRALPPDAEVEEAAQVPNPISRERVPEPEMVRVTIRTEEGEIVLSLDAERAPTTVARFLGLARDGYFDGLIFHRVVPAFVVQGGDPRGDGYGGPGFAQRCEDNRLRYERGTIGMALAGRDTGGSQFFITHGPQPHLEGRYTPFGRVDEGMDVVDRLMVGATIEAIEAPVSRETD